MKVRVMCEEVIPYLETIGKTPLVSVLIRLDERGYQSLEIVGGELDGLRIWEEVDKEDL